MKKAAIFLATGFEEIEALTVVDICRRCGIVIDMVSVTGEEAVTGSHGITVKTDAVCDAYVFEGCDMLILPGGMPGTKNLEAEEKLMQQIDSFYETGKYVAAICAAPSILGHRGILKGRNACCYPGFEEQLEGADVTKNPVEISENVITSRGMGTAIEFGLAVASVLGNKEKAEEVAHGIIYR